MCYHLLAELRHLINLWNKLKSKVHQNHPTSCYTELVASRHYYYLSLLLFVKDVKAKPVYPAWVCALCNLQTIIYHGMCVHLHKLCIVLNAWRTLSRIIICIDVAFKLEYYKSKFPCTLYILVNCFNEVYLDGRLFY